MNRSQLNGFRATAGLGQGAVRNTNVRSNDKMGGYNSFEQAPTYEGGGMQMTPQEMGGQQQWGQNSPQQYTKPVIPQFNAPGVFPQMGGMGQPSAYSQQLNRFVGAGGQMSNFKPRMGAVGPQYRNQGFRPPAIPQITGNKPFGGNIDPVDPYVGA